SFTVPAKSPNQAEGRAAEATEGGELAKGNSPEHNALRTEGRESTRSALERVRSIEKDAAAGVDGETWEHYGEKLEANLQDLSPRLKRGAYRARPVRRVYIPKVGKPG